MVGSKVVLCYNLKQAQLKCTSTVTIHTATISSRNKYTHTILLVNDHLLPENTVLL